MTLVPQTGHVPDAALRPFLRVTTVPSNVRFVLHFTQYASYSATLSSFPPNPEAASVGGLEHDGGPVYAPMQAPLSTSVMAEVPYDGFPHALSTGQRASCEAGKRERSLR